MPTAKKTVRKKAAAPKGAISVIETAKVPTQGLNTFKGNPRVGNIDKIATSLKQFGQYRPILVNRGTHTGRPNEILAGNHTYLAMRKNGESEILVSFVDVDDATAKAMVLADNKLTEIGTFDDEALGRLLGDLNVELIDATGFTQSEVDELTGLIASQAQSVIDAMEDAEIEDSGVGFAAVDPDTAMFSDDDDGNEDTTDHFSEASEDLAGVVQLADDLNLPDSELLQPWGFPKLRPDRLVKVSDIPDNLRTWAGSATKDADYNTPEQWWFYNFGIDSTSGMHDVSKVILSFYCFDDYFENWWHNPAKYVTKCLNSGIKYIVGPDYSMWHDRPKAEWFWSAYRNRWLARYFQEAGLSLIPDITWPGGHEDGSDFLQKYVLPGIPKKTPVISIQVQTANAAASGDEDENMKRIAADLKIIEQTIEPSLIIIYGADSSFEWVKRQGLTTQLLQLDTRIHLLAESQKGRQKKTTL